MSSRRSAKKRRSGNGTGRSADDPLRRHAPSAERHAPQRIVHEEDEEHGPRTEESGEDDLTAEEIARESERWAPKKIRDTVVETETVEKVCHVCGKDLRGHRRYKDSRGYICISCDKDERARRIPCAECGKPTKPEGLRPWGPISICVRCWADHQNDPKILMRRKVSSKPWEEAEKRSVLVLAAATVLALLVLLIIASC